MIPHYCFLADEYKELRALSQSTDSFWEMKRSRARFVSASDVPTICGFGWQSIRQLAKEKMGISARKVSDYATMIMKRGQELEPLARLNFTERTGITLVQTGMWIHPIDQRLSASPDALCVTIDGLCPLEIKCPVPTTLVDDRRRHKDSLQLQTQIQCTAAPYGFLFYFFPDEPERCEITLYLADWEQWLDIVAHSDWFINCVYNRVIPKASLTEKEYEQNRSRYMLQQDEYWRFLKQLSTREDRRPTSPVTNGLVVVKRRTLPTRPAESARPTQEEAGKGKKRGGGPGEPGAKRAHSSESDSSAEELTEP